MNRRNQNLGDELQRRFTDLSSGRIGLPELLSWAGQLDLAVIQTLG